MSELQPKLCVLMAVFNGARWVPQQLETILKQFGVSVSVMVSVDPSADGSESLISMIAASDCRVFLLPTGEKFGGAGANFYRLLRDVDMSGFDYICYADQDDLWNPDKLWRAHCLMTENDAGGYSSNVMAFWSDGRTKPVDKAHPQRQWDFLFEAAGPGCTYVMRQDLALAVQNLVRSRWDAVRAVALHDWLSYAFARANLYKWVIDPNVGMLYRQHAANQVGVNAGWRAFKYRVGKVLGGWGTAQAATIASLVGLDNSPFVRRWKSCGRVGMLWLAFNANQCRRRRRDRVLFALSCVILAVLGRTHKP